MHRCNGYELGQTLGAVRGREAWRAAGHGVAVRHDWVAEQKQPTFLYYLPDA